jgi:hypothetical protein
MDTRNTPPLHAEWEPASSCSFPDQQCHDIAACINLLGGGLASCCTWHASSCPAACSSCASHCTLQCAQLREWPHVHTAAEDAATRQVKSCFSEHPRGTQPHIPARALTCAGLRDIAKQAALSSTTLPLSTATQQPPSRLLLLVLALCNLGNGYNASCCCKTMMPCVAPGTCQTWPHPKQATLHQLTTAAFKFCTASKPDDECSRQCTHRTDCGHNCGGLHVRLLVQARQLHLPLMLRHHNLSSSSSKQIASLSVLCMDIVFIDELLPQLQQQP